MSQTPTRKQHNMRSSISSRRSLIVGFVALSAACSSSAGTDAHDGGAKDTGIADTGIADTTAHCADASVGTIVGSCWLSSRLCDDYGSMTAPVAKTGCTSWSGTPCTHLNAVFGCLDLLNSTPGVCDSWATTQWYYQPYTTADATRYCLPGLTIYP